MRETVLNNTLDSHKRLAASNKRFNHIVLIGVTSVLLMVSSCVRSENASGSDLIIIEEQGSFAVGGTVITNPGTFDPNNPTPAGQTFRGDHTYVFYQIPVDARDLPLVMWHGSRIGNVTFEPGARTNWHSHPGGQILLVTNGAGYHQEQGGPIQLLRRGDVVEIGPNVMHWHGATPSGEFTHVAVVTNSQAGNTVWLQPVTDAEYNRFW